MKNLTQRNDRENERAGSLVPSSGLHKHIHGRMQSNIGTHRFHIHTCAQTQRESERQWLGPEETMNVWCHYMSLIVTRKRNFLKKFIQEVLYSLN